MLGQLNKKMWYRLVSLVVAVTFVFSNIATAGVISTFKLRNNSAKADSATTVDAQKNLALKNAIKSGARKGDLIVAQESLEGGLFNLLTAQGLNSFPCLLALNNGTAHGNNYDKDGNLIETEMNLQATDTIAQVLAYYGIKVVQHGMTGTPLKNIPALRKVGIRIGHVGTNWQNIAWEIIVQEAKTNHPELQDLVNRMIDDLVKVFGKKYNVTQREGAKPKDLEKLIGKELKNLIGKYSAEWENLPPDVREKIDLATEKSATEHIIALGGEGTADLVRDYLQSGLIVPVQKSTAFNIGFEPVEPRVVDDFSLNITGATAAVLAVKGLRGKAQKLVAETEKLGSEIKALDREKDKLIIEAKNKEIKRLKDGPIQDIKNESDAAAKAIFQEVVNREKIILIARVSEGFGRDALKESIKAGDVVIPESLKDEESGILKAVQDGLDEYTSASGEMFRIEYGIMDVIEGTNPFVANVAGKSTNDLKEKEAGGTSIMLYGPGVKKFMHNTLDAYIDQIVTHVPPEKLIEFIANPLDPELTADGDVGKIELMLNRIAVANNLKQGINDLEVVIMDRPREKARIAAINKLQEKYTGLKLTTIKDGTVAHGIDAILGIKTREKHKVMMTVVGAPEGEYVRAIASIYKKLGALTFNRLFSENVNKTAEGKDANDLKNRYAFGEKPKKGEEESEIDAIKKAYPEQWKEIVAGKVLFMHSDIGASIRGAMAYITNNGVFRKDGVEVGEKKSKVNFLRIGIVNGKPCAWFETRLIDNAGTIIDPVKPVTFEVQEGASNPGRIVLDALADTDRIIMATNIRTTLSIDGIIKAAMKTNSFIIFQQAMSELDYTYKDGFSFDNPKKFAELIKARAKALGFKNFIIKGDHVTVKADKEFLKNSQAQKEVAGILKELLQEKDLVKRGELFANKVKEFKNLPNPSQTQKDVTGALKSIEKAYWLVDVEVRADFTEFALDASFMPMRLNALVSAFLAKLIPQDSGVETEVGEIGGDDNSTIADVLELLFGKRYLENIFAKGGAKFSKLGKYGPAVPIIDAFSDDIDIEVADAVVEKHIRGNKAIPIIINYASLVESGPDGALALENVLKKLSEKAQKLLTKGEVSKNNIKFILDVPDKISTEEADKLVDKFFAMINEINGDFSNLSRDMFASIVIGKNPANVVNVVKEKFGTDIYGVIGSQGYVDQFKGSSKNMIALGQTKEKGQTVSMAKALKLALSLILSGAPLTNEKVNALDALFTQDSVGSFTIKPNALIPGIASAVEEYKAEVAAVIAI